MNDTTMTRKSDPKYDDDLVNKRYVDRMLLDYCHPVGQIFITTNDNFNPNTMFGGTWEQITSDAYLKIVTSNGGSLGGTSSDHKIPTSSIPSHSHIQRARTADGHWNGTVQENSGGSQGGAYPAQAGWTNNGVNWGTTVATGGGQAYYPYYLGVYVWKRTG